ncbi:MAG: bacterial Ig-like domain-containing protein [Anaeroplasmataceae bacterium]|nr:bacterial Ig-like domain-containing protein [Anaeroplasmataceae bacterium]
MKKILFLIFSLLCIFTVTSCDNKKEDKPPVQEIEKIEVIFNSKGGSSIASVEIEKGGKVSKPDDPKRDGYTFAGWYTSEECTSGTEFDFAKELEQGITLYAKWIEVSQSAKVVSIEIKTQPTKLTYIEGEIFDKTGMVIEGTLSDGTKEEITNYTVMPNGELPLGLEMFSVSYGDLEVFGSLTVVAKEIVTIEIETMPTKTSYKNYETFDPSGLVLKVSYNNGKSELVDSNYKHDRGMLFEAPNFTIVTYAGIEVEVPITVTKIAHYGIPNAKESTFIDAKAVYNQLGLTPDNNRIEATTTFGDVQIVASPGRVMQWEGVGTGLSKYDYYYFDHAFEGLIKFAGASSPDGRYIVVTPTEDGRLNFWAARPSSGESSLLIFDNYTEATLPEDAKQIITLDTGSEYSIPVYAGETYYITATANAFIRAIALVYNPTYYEVSDFALDTTNVCKDFAVGQTFNADGLLAKVKLMNDDIYDLKASQFEVEFPDMTTAGVKTITVRYQGMLEKTYDITVHALTGIEVTTLPTKNEYFAGENLEVDGLEVMAVANNIKYPISDFVISKTEKLAVGDVIVVSWNDFETTLDVVIKENPILGIRVHTPPTKTSYKSGEIFDSTGLVLEVLYDGRDSVFLEDLSEVTFNKTVLAAGDTSVEASWDIFTCEIEIEVLVVDWYEKDETTYVQLTDILSAFGLTEWGTSGNFPAGGSGTINEFYFDGTGAAFQYANSSTEYTFDGHTYTGQFRTGDTRTGRYIRITPLKNGKLTLYVGAAAGGSVYLVTSLEAPDADDPNTYLDKFNDFSGTGNMKTVTFDLEADQTYYLWFTSGQYYIRGMNLSYSRVKEIAEELVVDATEAKTTFHTEEEFSYEALKVSVRCADGNVYELTDREFTVTAPDMTTAGVKIVQVKFGEVTIGTYEVVVQAD